MMIFGELIIPEFMAFNPDRSLMSFISIIKACIVTKPLSLISLSAAMSLLSIDLNAQNKYSIDKGRINFTSNAQLELIQASSDKVQGLIDPSTQQFAFTVDVKSFTGFNSELQREHFNEKYMESEKHPKARFSGKIIEPIDFGVDNSYDVRAKGDLEIHGQKQTRIIKSKITIKNGILNVVSSFNVPLSDHNIAIPNIVSQKIATEIEVEFNASLKLKLQ